MAFATPRLFSINETIMAIKTYGIDGKTAACWPISNPTGDVTLKLTFRNGSLDERQKRPATCIVSNPVDQLIIENHPLFRKGIIRLISVGGTAETAKTAKINEAVKEVREKKSRAKARTVVSEAMKDEATGFTTYPNVKTVGDATNVLLSLGVNMGQLRDEDEILAKAAEMKLTFPNYEG